VIFGRSAKRLVGHSAGSNTQDAGFVGAPYLAVEPHGDPA
jgi:hypothetical protein